MNGRLVRWVVALLFVLAGAVSAQEIVLTADHADGVYAPGEKVVWRVETKGDKADTIKQAKYAIKNGGFAVLKQGSVDLSNGPATIEGAFEGPGALLAEVRFKPEGAAKEIRGLGGAVAEATKIGVSAARPDDFDAWWKAKIDALGAIPINAKVEAGDSGKANVEYYKVTLDNINGTHVYGQLARPKKDGKFPALLIVQYAGVYGLPKTNVTNRGEQGWLALNIMAHDLPFDKDAEFYKQQSAEPLKDYMAIGAEDRETSYFLRMYLGCYRAAEYLTTRDDWDGKTLVVMGTSQGGQQSIVTAGLHPKITAMLANVPAGCDVTANDAGRAFGFPYWGNYAKWKQKPQIVQTGRYFDAVNFASNVKCPAMVAMGLIDETCPPAGVLAACNQMTGKVERIIMPRSDHQGRGNTQAEFWKRSEAWLRELVKGEGVSATK
jgi:cephalosporin-C deacetylase-like acetyl esterase